MAVCVADGERIFGKRLRDSDENLEVAGCLRRVDGSRAAKSTSAE